jgi:tape measure domain-containing protein
MAVTVDTLVTQFKVSGHGDVISAFGRVAGAAGLAAAALTAAVAVGGGITALGIKAIKTASQFQTFQARMNAVFGSAKAGASAFDWAKQFAKDTPFKLMDVIEQMSNMKALGLNPFRDLGTIGDTASALGLATDGLERITLQLGQMKAVGKATMLDLRPLMQAGIPVLQILQEELGLSKDQLKDIGRLGLDADKTINALLNGMDKRFAGAMNIQMQAFAGKVSNLGDAWATFLDKVGSALLPYATAVVDKITAVLSDPKTISAALRFTSYLVAGIEGAATVAKRFTTWMFDRDAMAKWFHQFKQSLLNVLAIVVGFKTAMWGMELAVNGLINLSKNPALAAVQMMEGLAVPAGGLAIAAILRAQAENEKKKAAAINAPGLGDLFKGIDLKKRAAELQKQWAAGNFGLPVLQAKGGKGTRDTSGGADITKPNGLQAAIETVIIGGAERARRGAAGLNSLRNLKPGSVPPITVRIQSDANDPISKALDKRIEDVSSKVLERFINDPRYKNMRN